MVPSNDTVETQRVRLNWGGPPKSRGALIKPGGRPGEYYGTQAVTVGPLGQRYRHPETGDRSPMRRRFMRSTSHRQTFGNHKKHVAYCVESRNDPRNLFDNDPSAGSPTETLLRLLLPLNAQVWESFRATTETRCPRRLSPNTSLKHSIGSSDGRCVQRAGT